MTLQLPSTYPDDYWIAVRHKLGHVIEDPTPEKFLGMLLEVSKIDRCPRTQCPPDIDKLEHILNSYLKQDEARTRSLIQGICNLALEIEELFPAGQVESLNGPRSSVLSLSSTQVNCLLAQMFIGTFRCCVNKRFNQSRHANGPFSFAYRMSFLDWYSTDSFPTTNIYIRALLNLFEESVLGANNLNNVIFERRVLEVKLDLSKCTLQLVKVNVHLEGRIGDIEESEIDFANACVGGGPGGTQEELLLGISPQALPVGILNADPLFDSEAIVITGAKKFANYTDYGLDAFYIGKNVQDWDWSSRKIIAIDAIFFEEGIGDNRFLQMNENLLKREVYKCLVGMQAAKGLGVSTGHWGCGAFGGDKEIKAIIQVLAASVAEVKHLNFFAFGDKTFAEQFTTMMDCLYKCDIRVNVLWDILLNESKRLKKPKSFKDKYDPDPYLFNKISSNLSNS